MGMCVDYTNLAAQCCTHQESQRQVGMCVYMDLNKACPKDAYPLPNIDSLVNGATEKKVLSFLDAYFE